MLVGLAASGRTPYVLGAIAEARRLGAVTIGICCMPDSELSRAVEIAIAPLVGPEIIAGSTRLKAGTAKSWCSTCSPPAPFIRLGYVYGNLMVNVQPKNTSWWIARGGSSRRPRGSPTSALRNCWRQSGDSVRMAIVMAQAGVEPRRSGATPGRERRPNCIGSNRRLRHIHG